MRILAYVLSLPRPTADDARFPHTHLFLLCLLHILSFSVSIVLMAVADTDHAVGLLDDERELDTDPPESPLVRRVVPLPRRLAVDGMTDDSTQKRRQASLELLGSAYTSSMAQHPYYLPLFSASGPNGHVLPGQLMLDSSTDDDVSVAAVGDIDARHVVDPDAIESLPPCRSPFAFGTDGGIYMDQFTHPGNTKKRKVPVTAHGRASGVDGSSDIMPSEELADRSFLTDRILTANAQYYPLNALLTAKKSRISRATKANLQMKEMLKSRRRQLAPVLGLLLQNDSLALDHSLATLTSLYKRARDTEGRDLGLVVTRISQREKKRKARAQAAKQKEFLRSRSENGGEDDADLPSGLFTFEHDSLSEFARMFLASIRTHIYRSRILQRPGGTRQRMKRAPFCKNALMPRSHGRQQRPQRLRKRLRRLSTRCRTRTNAPANMAKVSMAYSRARPSSHCHSRKLSNSVREQAVARRLLFRARKQAPSRRRRRKSVRRWQMHRTRTTYATTSHLAFLTQETTMRRTVPMLRTRSGRFPFVSCQRVLRRSIVVATRRG